LLEEEQVLAYEFLGKRYDCGNKLGYLEAAVEYGLRHPEIGSAFADYLNRGLGYEERDQRHAQAA